MSTILLAGPPAMVDALTKDDPVSRLTLVIRDGKAVGVDAPKVVMLEGPKDVLDRAAKIATDNGGTTVAKPDKIIQAIKDEEDTAAGGVGFLFG